IPMPSQHETEFAAAAGQLMAQHGRAVSYTPVGGVAAAVWAIVGPLSTVSQQTENGFEGVRGRIVKLLIDPATAVYGGVADPQAGDQITVDGETYQVIDRAGFPAIARDGTFCEFFAAQISSRERSREGYRRESVRVRR
ncbi:MAG: hypothetical protein IMZ55_00640, partial [Acidobacteria bacterium]|nr:hypothetical protein [Acidobacteriota bacterium]